MIHRITLSLKVTIIESVPLQTLTFHIFKNIKKFILKASSVKTTRKMSSIHKKVSESHTA
jgi:hypothetical protein